MRRSPQSRHSGLGVSVSKWLEWTPRAGRDLLAIESFYAEQSQATADRVMGEIRHYAIQLETFPQIGRAAKWLARGSW